MSKDELSAMIFIQNVPVDVDIERKQAQAAIGITKNRPAQLECHCSTAQTTAQQCCRRAVWHVAWPKQGNASAFKLRTNNLVTN